MSFGTASPWAGLARVGTLVVTAFFLLLSYIDLLMPKLMNVVALDQSLAGIMDSVALEQTGFHQPLSRKYQICRIRLSSSAEAFQG